MPDGDEFEAMRALPQHKWSEVKNGHRAAGGAAGSVDHHTGTKSVAKLGLTATSTAATAATAATNTNSIAVLGAVLAGGTIATAGVGLVVGGAVMTVGQSMLAVTSLVSTIAHIEGLQEIQKNIGNYTGCRATPAAKDAAIYHAFIADKVLPYIVSQKKEKSVKKGASIIPGAGLLTSLYTLGRKITKPNKGLKRTFYANALGAHLITCKCHLAEVIVANLLGSAAEMQQLKLMDLSKVAPILMEKMKSF